MKDNNGSEVSTTDSSVIRIVAEIAGRPVEDNTMSALQHRADILMQTDTALRAVLSPQDSGGFSHDERAALACRIARINNNERLALFYAEHITGTQVETICDPAFDGADDTRLNAVLAFTDLVSSQPKIATESDVNNLKSAGITDADIVRLAELNAFLSFHIKVIEGLVLMVSQAATE